MGFIFFVVLVVGSSDFCGFGCGELDLGLCLGQNGARSRPLSRPAVVFFFSLLFLLLCCGFDNDLIMVGL